MSQKKCYLVVMVGTCILPEEGVIRWMTCPYVRVLTSSEDREVFEKQQQEIARDRFPATEGWSGFAVRVREFTQEALELTLQKISGKSK